MTSVLPSVPVTIARAWFRPGPKGPAAALGRSGRLAATCAKCGVRKSGHGRRQRGHEVASAAVFPRTISQEYRGLALTPCVRARAGRQMRRAHPGALPCAGLPAVIVSSAVSPKPSQLICRLYAARVRWSAAGVRSWRSWEHCAVGVGASAAGKGLLARHSHAQRRPARGLACGKRRARLQSPRRPLGEGAREMFERFTDRARRVVVRLKKKRGCSATTTSARSTSCLALSTRVRASWPRPWECRRQPGSGTPGGRGDYRPGRAGALGPHPVHAACEESP